MEKQEKSLYNTYQLDVNTRATTSKDGLIITLAQGEKMITLTLASLRTLFEELK